MKRTYLILVTLFSSIISIAQDGVILKEFKELSQHYEELNAFGIDFQMRYYDVNDNILTSQTGKVTHAVNLHYTKMGERISLLTDRYYISVNTANHFMVYNELKQIDRKNQPKPEMLEVSTMLDSLWASQKNLKFRTIQSKVGILRVFIEDSKNEFFEAYELVINTTKNQLLEYNYYFRTTEDDQQLSKIKITYSNETDQPKLNAEEFKMNYYLKKGKKELVTSVRFKDYELIDQTKIIRGL